MDKYRLSTKDNPFNPFTQWDDWYFYDLSKGYNTCERLARLAITADQLPDEVNESEIIYAMDQLIDLGAIDKNDKFVEMIKVKNPELKDENDQK